MSTPQQPNQGDPNQQPQHGQPQERVVYVEQKKKGGCMKWGGIIIAIIILIAILAAVFGGGDDDTNSEGQGGGDTNAAQDNNAEAPAEGEAPAEEGSTEFAVGDTYTTSDDLAITVDTVTTQTGPLGDSYLSAAVTYTNNGSEQVSFAPYDWSVQTPAGVVSDVTITALDNALSHGELAPGGTVSGNLYFEGTEPGEYRVIWEPSFSFSGDTATWVANI